MPFSSNSIGEGFDVRRHMGDSASDVRGNLAHQGMCFERLASGFFKRRVEIDFPGRAGEKFLWAIIRRRLSSIGTQSGARADIPH